MSNRFVQYLPCENNDFEVPHVGDSSQKAIKNDLEINLKMKRNFMHFEPHTLTETGPEITPKST